MSVAFAQRSEATVAEGEQPGRHTRGAIHLGAADIRRYFDIPPGTLRRWVREGHIEKVRRDTYDMASIMEYLERDAPRAHNARSAPSRLRLTS